MSARTVGKSAGGGGGLFTTGEYIGDGLATQAVVGIGFQPRYVLIYAQADVIGDIGEKTDQDGLNAALTNPTGGNTHVYTTDHIVSLDADGFTVGDGTGTANAFNVNLRVYTYVAFG